MNESRYGFLRALLITFGLICLIGLVWYSNTLSLITIVCGIISGIAGFALGVADIGKKTTLLRKFTLSGLALSGILASIVRMLEDSNLLHDLFGALPHLLSLILFATAMKVIIKQAKTTINEKEINQTQLTSH